MLAVFCPLTGFHQGESMLAKLLRPSFNTAVWGYCAIKETLAGGASPRGCVDCIPTRTPCRQVVV